MSIGYITRIESFSAAHRLHSPHLSAEENARVFGKCNHVNGHGHNYKVEITLRGSIDEKTGMIMNLTDLKAIMKKAVMDPLDHRHLDKDVMFFQHRPSTTENVAVFIWQAMRDEMERQGWDKNMMFNVRIHETEHNIVEYRGE